MEKLLAQDNVPTAVFASSDTMALGAIKAIRDAGLSVPKDISMVGFDDIELAQHITPALTTIRQNKELMGRRAADILINQMNQEEDQEEFNDYTAVVLQVELVNIDLILNILESLL